VLVENNRGKRNSTDDLSFTRCWTMLMDSFGGGKFCTVNFNAGVIGIELEFELHIAIFTSIDLHS
jgi:hypothetical protein